MRIRFVAVCAIVWAAGGAGAFAADKPMRFWNLTSATIVDLRLAPAGTQNFGGNLTKADKDGAVDHDERLPVRGVAPGRYDARIVQRGGRTCAAASLELAAGKVFTIEDKQLTGCTK